MSKILKFNFGILCIIFFNIQVSRAYFEQNATFKRIQRQTSRSTSCILPDHPTNGKWTVFGSGDSSLGPGMTISSGSVLEIECDDGYLLNSYYLLPCKNGEWSEPIGQCLKTCPPVYNTTHMSVTCKLNGLVRDCDRAIHNTIAQFKCHNFYEDSALETDPLRICRFGSWGRDLPKCQMKCGYASLRSHKLIVDGDDARPGEYPWQVALYRRRNLICGGSLIALRVILTAAHCVTKDTGTPYSKDLYTVAAGKYYREYNDSRDENEAQFSSLEKIIVSSNYQGDIQNFVGDIAILISKETFELSSRVLPVCIDWGGRYLETLQTASTNNITGFVSGWGLTSESDKPAKVLKKLEVPVVLRDECKKHTDEDVQVLLTYDKLCAGYLETGKAVCKGDSGGGLVIKYGARYFVMGIVSTSTQGQSEQGGCNSQQYGVFTNVSNYIQFIYEIWEQYKPLEDSTISYKNIQKPPQTTTTYSNPNCTLPYDNLFAFQSISNENLVLLPGATVESGEIIQISCIDGFILSGKATTSCLNGKWKPNFGQCLKTCPPFWQNGNVNAFCSLPNGASVSCSNPMEGTTATLNCTVASGSQRSNNFVTVCRNGRWDRQDYPRCVLGCGRRIKDNSRTNSRTNLNEVYPWHAGLYQTSGHSHVCGGTLISENAILTAAICITNIEGNLKQRQDYEVAVGKYYKMYDDPRDTTSAQFSEVKKMLVHPQFKGKSDDFQHDVAVVITTKKFSLTKTVNLACVDWDSNYVHASKNPFLFVDKKDTAYVSGWDSNGSELTELEIPTKNISMCFAFDFFQSGSGDSALSTKTCLNGDDRGLCKYRGEGLVIKLDGKYFVLSVLGSPTADVEKCNNIVHLYFYMDFISGLRKNNVL